jgi:Tol biopolymer transport system component
LVHLSCSLARSNRLASRSQIADILADRSERPEGRRPGVSSRSRRPRQLVWFDRTGANRGAVGPPDEGALAGPEISHDGRHAAVYRTVGSNTDVSLIDLGRGVSSRFTFHEQIDFFPVWSADDQRIIFGSNRNGTYEFFEQSAASAGDDVPIALKTTTSGRPTCARRRPRSRTHWSRFATLSWPD